MELIKNDLFQQQAFINGKWCSADSGETLTVKNPADHKLLGTVPCMGQTETIRAIEAARSALPAWRAKTAKERAAILRKWFDLMLKHQSDLAKIMTLEQGKPLKESESEILYAASFIEWFSEEGKRAYGDVIPPTQTHQRLMVIKQPVGVTAAITPWNFPSAMITRKAAPALASGCTMVLKPASQTPFSALALAKLAEEAGVPAGVLNIVTGNSEPIAHEMTQNPIVRKLSFTGSTQVGRILMAQCAHDIKKLSLELGGNAPFIVFNDADLDSAVQGALASKFRNAGQTCVCTNRLYVQSGIYDSFVQKFTDEVLQLKVGNGLNHGVDMGPLINANAIGKVQEHIDDALSLGATLVCGGNVITDHYFEPTVLKDVPHNAKISKEETFGPLAPIFRFDQESDAIRMANDTEFGLAAYFYTQNLARTYRVSEALEYGMVGVNTGLISNEVVPFGGVKASGLGREGSKYGLDEYLELKYICIGGLNMEPYS